MDGYSDNRPDNGSGAALVLGILSIVFLFICQVAGLILGIIGLRKSGRGRGESRDADAAWVLSVIGIVLNAVILALLSFLLDAELLVRCEILPISDPHFGDILRGKRSLILPGRGYQHDFTAAHADIPASRGCQASCIASGHEQSYLLSQFFLIHNHDSITRTQIIPVCGRCHGE